MTNDSLDDNSELRQQAVTTIANYMHHELFGITQAQAGNAAMDQADELLQAADRAIKRLYEKHAEMKAKGFI